MRITSEHSPLSFLSQRLAYASRNRIRAINLVENVPVWPARFRPELHERAQPDIFHYAPAEGDETLLRLLLERENARAGGRHADDPEHPRHQRRHARPVPAAGSAGSSAANDPLPIAGLHRHNRPDAGARLHRQALPRRHRPGRLDEQHAVGRRGRHLREHPHNPTGSVLPAASLQALIDRAGMHGARVIVDAVYEDFVFDGQCCHLPRQPDCEHVAVLNSVSKNFGAPACGSAGSSRPPRTSPS